MNTNWIGYMGCLGLVLAGCASVKAYAGPTRPDPEVAAIRASSMTYGGTALITRVDNESYLNGYKIVYLLPGEHTIVVSCGGIGAERPITVVLAAGQDYAAMCDRNGASIIDATTPRQDW